MKCRSRRAMTLLEVMVALVILGSAATALMGMTAQSWRAIHSARHVDRSLTEASAFLGAVALWPREDLDRRLGDRAQHPWRMRIERPHPTLYVVVLADSSGRDTLLVTSLYRPESVRAR